MDEVQEKHERAVGNYFIEWYNANQGTNYSYLGRGTPTPDLIYADGIDNLMIEIGDAYYDDQDAAMRWGRARGKENVSTTWSGHNFDKALVAKINAIIKDKSVKDYGKNCILVVNVSPPLTTGNEMQEFLPQISIPEQHNFKQIYLTGWFGQSVDSKGGYRCWQIF